MIIDTFIAHLSDSLESTIYCQLATTIVQGKVLLARERWQYGGTVFIKKM